MFLSKLRWDELYAYPTPMSTTFPKIIITIMLLQENNNENKV